MKTAGHILNLELVFLFLLFLLSRFSYCGAGENGIASQIHSKVVQMKRCPYKLRRLWQTDISSFPFAASPLVADVDGDGGLDVIAAPFGETFAVIDGETGKHLHDTSWPQHNLDKSVHSSPLQYDVDGDGMLDILFVTSQGELLFYTRTGHVLHQYNTQLQPAYVKADWFKHSVSVTHANIKDYVSVTKRDDTLPVDSHVLSTPVFYDMRQLVMPVSYFFADDDYDPSESHGPWGASDIRDKFYVTGLVIIDMETFAAAKMSNGDMGTDWKNSQGLVTVFLELWQSPSFTLFSPTVINVDGDFGSPEILVAPSSPSGNLYVLNMDGSLKQTWALPMNQISGRISVANLDSEPSLELLVCNRNGTLLCLDGTTGRSKWSASIGGAIAGSRFADVDVDGQLDVIAATDDGSVYALNGKDGSVLPKYPFKAGKRIVGHVLITKFSAIRPSFDLVFISDDGLLHVLASDHSCHLTLALGESTLVDLSSNNLVLMSRGSELLIPTADGSLVCVGSGQETPIEELVDHEYQLNNQRLISPSDPLSHNDFITVVHRPAVLIDESTKLLKEVTGSSFDLYFGIHTRKAETFDVKVFMGSSLVEEMSQVSSLSELHVLSVKTPERPGHAQVTVVIYDRHGFVDRSSLFLKFNQLILLDLQWLVLAPFIGMLVILLVNHGFPAKDLLPVTFPFKSK